jgi:hypothetical protein
MLGAMTPTDSERPTATDADDAARRAGALERALAEALAELPDGGAAAPGLMDRRWLAIGLRLGLERPVRARHLLELTRDREADPAAPSRGDAGGVGPAGEPVTAPAEGSGRIPLASLLLTRAAALPWSERAGMAPEVAFGWAAGLAPGQILSLGRVVHDMLAAGSPPDIGRGFGLTWDAGVRLPRQERDALFREFTELQLTAGGVLTGGDLRAAGPAARPRGFGAMLDQLVTRARPEDVQAAAALEGSGEPGRRGLVALWNAWMAMRYRSVIPAPTFDLLVRPWVSVVGPLPEP